MSILRNGHVTLSNLRVKGPILHGACTIGLIHLVFVVLRGGYRILERGGGPGNC